MYESIILKMLKTGSSYKDTHMEWVCAEDLTGQRA